MRNLRAVLCLGALAFKTYLGHLQRQGVEVRGLRFSHGARYRLDGMPTLYASYHPSPRNTNTGVLTQGMLVKVLRRMGAGLDQAPSKHN